MLLAEFGWPHAVTAVGVSLAFAACVWALFWSLARSDGPARPVRREVPMWTETSTKVELSPELVERFAQTGDPQALADLIEKATGCKVTGIEDVGAGDAG